MSFSVNSFKSHFRVLIYYTKFWWWNVHMNSGFLYIILMSKKYGGSALTWALFSYKKHIHDRNAKLSLLFTMFYLYTNTSFTWSWQVTDARSRNGLVLTAYSVQDTAFEFILGFIFLFS
jgi:hypothetical protein